LVGEVGGPNDRGAADLHLPGQPVESFACFPPAVELQRELLVLGHKRLAGLTRLAVAAIDAARRLLPRAVQVEGIADDFNAHAECREIRSTPDPASVISTICGSMNSYFGSGRLNTCSVSGFASGPPSF
jgi:hypothetical protein